jgi:methylated-DNA-[protein]-cysteine S-methyltransferase
MIRERKPTIFEQKVFDLVRTIPAGKVSTYGDIAAALGMRSSQAIGQALRRNPFAPEVPCHRVICSSGKIGGFHGESAGPRIDQKLTMLRNEGIGLEAGCIDLRQFRHTFSNALVSEKMPTQVA